MTPTGGGASGGQRTRFTSAHNALSRLAVRAAGNGCEPEFSESPGRPLGKMATMVLSDESIWMMGVQPKVPLVWGWPIGTYPSEPIGTGHICTRI